MSCYCLLECRRMDEDFKKGDISSTGFRSCECFFPSLLLSTSHYSVKQDTQLLFSYPLFKHEMVSAFPNTHKALWHKIYRSSLLAYILEQLSKNTVFIYSFQLCLTA